MGDVKHPISGWIYPFVESVDILDCGFSIALALRHADGSVTHHSVRLKDLRVAELLPPS